MFTKAVGPSLCLALLLVLSACGSTWEDRALTGGAMGAGAGALLGLVIPGIGPPIGAAIGAGVGAGTGALTTKEEIDIGDPIYR